ncbi:hypothetical protein V1509DRAFT_614451 [Lipomyces kononenkoae]
MAKLVEHVTTETVDSVKRRFLRQNRELARVNSSHSTRIGNLESKIASLISENLELRQQVIAIEHSREKWIARACSDVRMKIQRKVREIEELLESFEMSAKDAIYVSPAAGSESDDMGRRDSLDNSIVCVPPSAIHISTRKKSSPKGSVTSPPPVYPDLDDGNDDAGTQVDELISDNRPRSPQLKEAHKFMPEELSAEEIPESPSELADEQQLPNIVSGTETIRPRRRRRDSLHELDIVSMVKTQNANYKAKLSSQHSSDPDGEPETMSKEVWESCTTTEDGGAISIALSENLPPSPPPPPPEPVPVAVREAKRSDAKPTTGKRRASMTTSDPSCHTVEKSTRSMLSSRPSSRRSSVYRESSLETTEISNEVRASSTPPPSLIETRRLSRRSSISTEPAADKAAAPSVVPTDHIRVKLGEKDKNVVDSKEKKASNAERKALQPLNVNLEPEVGAGTAKMPVEVKPAEVNQERQREPEQDRQMSTSPDGGRRASRQRKSVNYALPSLRVKMRRDQAQLVDAVAVPDHNGITSETQNQRVDVGIKREENTDEVRVLDFSKIPEAGGMDMVKRKRLSSVTDDIKRESTDEEEKAAVDSRPAKATGVTKPRRRASMDYSPPKREVHKGAGAAKLDSGNLTLSTTSAVVGGARRPNRHDNVELDKTGTAAKRRLSMVA